MYRIYLTLSALLLTTIGIAQNVGIGTDSPQVKLHLRDSVASVNTHLLLDSEGSPVITLDGPQSFSKVFTFQDDATTKATITYLNGSVRFFTDFIPLIPKPVMTLSSNNSVGINLGALGIPTQRLDVAGKIRIGNDSTAPTPGTLRYYEPDSAFQFFDGLQWRDAASQWITSGSFIHYDDGAVLIGRSNTIGAERFGVRYQVAGASYGGMYIETNGHSGSRPFYGYAINNTGKMWHYYDGLTGAWNLYNDGIRLSVDSTGEVGIGTTTPVNRLDVKSFGPVDTADIVLGLISDGSNRPTLQFSEWSTATPESGMSIEYDGTGPGVDNKLHFRGVDVVRRFTFTSGGEMGIGVEDPNEMFEVGGDGRMFVGDGQGANRRGLLIDAVETGDYVRINPYDYGTDTNMDLYIPSDVSIGSTTTATGYKLSVDGRIIAEELKVQLSQSWPDYVFADGYELKSIDQLEQFIHQNGHLPGIPSSEDVETTNGIEVGEMNRLLLEKVEELTLHIINLNREIADLKAKSNK